MRRRNQPRVNYSDAIDESDESAPIPRRKQPRVSYSDAIDGSEPIERPCADVSGSSGCEKLFRLSKLQRVMKNGDLGACEGLIENSSDPSLYLHEIHDGYDPFDISVPLLQLCLDNGANPGDVSSVISDRGKLPFVNYLCYLCERDCFGECGTSCGYRESMELLIRHHQSTSDVNRCKFMNDREIAFKVMMWAYQYHSDIFELIQENNLASFEALFDFSMHMARRLTFTDLPAFAFDLDAGQQLLILCSWIGGLSECMRLATSDFGCFCLFSECIMKNLPIIPIGSYGDFFGYFSEFYLKNWLHRLPERYDTLFFMEYRTKSEMVKLMSRDLPLQESTVQRANDIIVYISQLPPMLMTIPFIARSEEHARLVVCRSVWTPESHYLFPSRKKDEVYTIFLALQRNTSIRRLGELWIEVIFPFVMTNDDVMWENLAPQVTHG